MRRAGGSRTVRSSATTPFFRSSASAGPTFGCPRAFASFAGSVSPPRDASAVAVSRWGTERVPASRSSQSSASRSVVLICDAMISGAISRTASRRSHSVCAATHWANS